MLKKVRNSGTLNFNRSIIAISIGTKISAIVNTNSMLAAVSTPNCNRGKYPIRLQSWIVLYLIKPIRIIVKILSVNLISEFTDISNVIAMTLDRAMMP